MKVILTSIGTRGDMEPFLALGTILKESGYHVICLFPEQFRPLAEDAGLEFRSLGSKFIELLDSPAGRIAMGGGRFGWKKLKAYMKLIAVQSAANKEMTQRQEEYILKENPDRVVHHPKAIFPVLWREKNREKVVLLSPVPYLHYVEGHPVIMLNKDYGRFLNKLTYKLADMGLVKNIAYAQKWLQDKSYKISSKKIGELVASSKVVYAISPSLFQRPSYWPQRLQVLGFHERNKYNHWKPTSTLEQFLEKHPKVLMITFGSMINNKPKETTQSLIDVLEKNNIAAIINTSFGGLTEPQAYNRELIHFVKDIPYDWVFPRTYAIIHHGGSGTTHMALKYGCANMVIPHIADQFVWNKIVHQKCTGPLGIDVSKITVSTIESKILDLMHNVAYKQNAQKVSRQMQKEDYKKEIAEFIIN